MTQERKQHKGLQNTMHNLLLLMKVHITNYLNLETQMTQKNY